MASKQTEALMKSPKSSSSAPLPQPQKKLPSFAHILAKISPSKKTPLLQLVEQSVDQQQLQIQNSQNDNNNDNNLLTQEKVPEQADEIKQGDQDEAKQAEKQENKKQAESEVFVKPSTQAPIEVNNQDDKQEKENYEESKVTSKPAARSSSASIPHGIKGPSFSHFLQRKSPSKNASPLHSVPKQPPQQSTQDQDIQTNQEQVPQQSDQIEQEQENEQQAIRVESQETGQDGNKPEEPPQERVPLEFQQVESLVVNVSEQTLESVNSQFSQETLESSKLPQPKRKVASKVMKRISALGLRSNKKKTDPESSSDKKDEQAATPQQEAAASKVKQDMDGPVQIKNSLSPCGCLSKRQVNQKSDQAANKNEDKQQFANIVQQDEQEPENAKPVQGVQDVPKQLEAAETDITEIQVSGPVSNTLATQPQARVDARVCKAMAKVVFPWTSCVK